jgi:pimeloyl-ACP methyl ester carboxylesterase
MDEARALLAAATHRRVPLPERGIELAVLDWGGDGPLALLHHATGFCKGTWAPVADALRRDVRVVALDARGHGDSSKPTGEGAYGWDRFAEDLAALAAVLAAEAPDGRVAVGVGNSFGGTAMVGAAARRPELFARLVLVDAVVPPPEPAARDAVAAITRRMVDGAARRRAHWPSRAEARAHLAARSLFARWRDLALDAYVLDGLADAPDGGVVLKCPAAIEAAVFAATHSFDVFARARAVACPTTVLWAARDSFSRPTHEALAAALPRGRFVALDAGHLVPMEDPEVVVAHVRAALRASG